MLEAIERGIERALLDEKAVPGDLLNPEEYSIPVQLAERDGTEDEQVQCSGEKRRAVAQKVS